MTDLRNSAYTADASPVSAPADDVNDDGSLLVFDFSAGQSILQITNQASAVEGAQTTVTVEASLDGVNWADVTFQSADSATPSFDEGGGVLNHSTPGVVAGEVDSDAHTTATCTRLFIADHAYPLIRVLCVPSHSDLQPAVVASAAAR